MEHRSSDEHEEGEIVDDFEDISDSSIPSTSQHSGKSVSHRDLLQGVSLSSISDHERERLVYVDKNRASRTKRAKSRRNSNRSCHRRKRHKCNHYYATRRLSRYKSTSSDSSDSSSDDLELDRQTHRQLRAAIRIDRSHHIHHNSLSTRLKAMMGNEQMHSKSEEEDEDTLRTLALLSSSKDAIVQNETEQVEKSEEQAVEDKDDELIELRLAALKSAVLKKVPEIRRRKCKMQPPKSSEINKENVNQENNVKEVDENCTPENDIEQADGDAQGDLKNFSLEEDIDIMRAKLLASMSKKIALDLPKQAAVAVIAKNGDKRIILKQHMKVKPLIINLRESDSDTDVGTKQEKTNGGVNEASVDEFLRKQRAAVEAKNLPLSVNGEGRLDKSVLKLLPKSQQKEYHLLKLKLLQAKSRRKPAQDVKNDEVLVPPPKRKEAAPKKEDFPQEIEVKPALRKALEDLQNGRLQMKGKYKALVPLLQKVNQAGIERKRCELHLKTLLNSLQKARDKLAASHKNYLVLVTRLKNYKNVIDRRSNKSNNLKIVRNNVRVVNNTSTPLKRNDEGATCDISAIQNSIEDNVTTREPEQIPETEEKPAEHEEVLQLNPADDANNAKECECDNDGATFKQYVSPLDNKNRELVQDPLMTFCPYDLFGVCKDAECKFNHCART